MVVHSLLEAHPPEKSCDVHGPGLVFQPKLALISSLGGSLVQPCAVVAFSVMLLNYSGLTVIQNSLLMRHLFLNEQLHVQTPVLLVQPQHH